MGSSEMDTQQKLNLLSAIKFIVDHNSDFSRKMNQLK